MKSFKMSIILLFVAVVGVIVGIVFASFDAAAIIDQTIQAREQTENEGTEKGYQAVDQGEEPYYLTDKVYYKDGVLQNTENNNCVKGYYYDIDEPIIVDNCLYCTEDIETPGNNSLCFVVRIDLDSMKKDVISKNGRVIRYEDGFIIFREGGNPFVFGDSHELFATLYFLSDPASHNKIDLHYVCCYDPASEKVVKRNEA